MCIWAELGTLLLMELTLRNQVQGRVRVNKAHFTHRWWFGLGWGQRTIAVVVPEMSLMPIHILLLAVLVMTFKEGLGWHSPVKA